jgi:hypothetical protein
MTFKLVKRFKMIGILLFLSLELKLEMDLVQIE